MDNYISIYRAFGSQAVLTLIPGEEFLLEYKQEIYKKLHEMEVLPLAEDYDLLPLEYEPTDVDQDATINFHVNEWHIIACIEGDDGVQSALLLKKTDLHFAIVIDMHRYELLQEIHGKLGVEEFGEILDATMVYELTKEEQEAIAKPFEPTTNKKPLDMGYAPVPTEEDDPDYVDEEALSAIQAPSFEGYSKKAFRDEGHIDVYEPEIEEEEEPGTVDISALKASFQGGSNRKPGRILDERKAKKPAPITLQEEEEEGVENVDVSSLNAPFVGNNSKKPKRIGGNFFKKEKPEQPEEKEEEPIAQNVDWKQMTGDFSPNSSSSPLEIKKEKPETIKEEPREEVAQNIDWKQMTGDFSPNSSSNPSQIKTKKPDAIKAEQKEYTQPVLDTGSFEPAAKPEAMPRPKEKRYHVVPEFLFATKHPERHAFHSALEKSEAYYRGEKEIRERLGSLKTIDVDVYGAFFAPQYPENDAKLLDSFRNFNIADWGVMAFYNDDEGHVNHTILIHREMPFLKAVIGLAYGQTPRLFAIIQYAAYAFQESGILPRDLEVAALLDEIEEN